MAAHDWELVRDLGLAMARNDQPEVLRLTLEIQARQAVCSHVANPERPERCYKCGAAPVVVSKPGPVKARARPLDIKRTA